MITNLFFLHFRCRTVYDTTFEKKCKTIYKKVCEQIYVTKVDWDYEEKCETVYEEKCHGYGYDKHCEPVPKESCHQVPVKVEKQVPKTKCKKVPDKKCSDVPKFVPRKECKDFPKKVCTKDPIQVPRNIQIKVCSAHPKEVCIKIPKEVLIQVPKQVTKKVCKSTKHDGGYNDDHHSGYGREGPTGDVADEPEYTIETYEFDGIEEVEFTELHKISDKERALHKIYGNDDEFQRLNGLNDEQFQRNNDERFDTLQTILTPEWFVDNNDWKKRVEEQEIRDGRSIEDLWGIDSLLKAEPGINKTLNTDNTTDFISDTIRDVTSDRELGVIDWVHATKNAKSLNETITNGMTIEFDKEKSRGFYLHDKTNQKLKKVSSEAEENKRDDNNSSKVSQKFQLPDFGGFSPFSKQNPFPKWR